MSVKLKQLVERLGITQDERDELWREIDRSNAKCSCAEGLWVRVEVKANEASIGVPLGPDHMVEPPYDATATCYLDGVTIAEAVRHDYSSGGVVRGVLGEAAAQAATWTDWSDDVQADKGGRLVHRTTLEAWSFGTHADIDGMRRSVAANLNRMAASLGLPPGAFITPPTSEQIARRLRGAIFTDRAGELAVARQIVASVDDPPTFVPLDTMSHAERPVDSTSKAVPTSPDHKSTLDLGQADP